MRYLYQPRRKLTPEETAANAAKRAARAKAAMTCQCCGRSILANTGKIALHGYERPGSGWQTASCMGAKHLPFEVSRDRLGDMIEVIKGMIANNERYLAAVKAETQSVPFSYSVREGTGPSYMRQRVEKTVQVTRATFDAIKAELSGEFRMRSVYDFDAFKARAISNTESILRSLQTDLTMQQARYDGWKQTHRWANGEWLAV